MIQAHLQGDAPFFVAKVDFHAFSFILPPAALPGAKLLPIL